MKKFSLLVLALVIHLFGISQYYTALEINTIHNNKSAAEGDFYIDTLDKRYYIGISSGKLLEIGKKVDSLKINEDTLRLYQGKDILMDIMDFGKDNSFEISQTSHGFGLPNWGVIPLFYNTSTNRYQLALSSSVATSASLLAVNLPNNSTLTIQNTGYLTISHGLAVGYWWSLSNTNPGEIIREDLFVCNPNQVSQRLFFTASTDKILLQPEQPKQCNIGPIIVQPPPILSACPSLITNYFNEAQYSWGFNVRNTSGTAMAQWQIVINNADYQLDISQISNNTQFTYVEIDNGNGTYDHYFTSVSGLAAFASSSNFAYSQVNFGFNPTSSSIDYNCTQ